MPCLHKLFIFFAICCLPFTACNGYAQQEKEPIVVNGDEVEYSTDKNEITATGNVEVTHKGSKLTCEKLTVNTQTKDAVALGRVRLTDKDGVVKADYMVYNFETQTGRLQKGVIASLPYYGKGDTITRVSETRFDVKSGYITTCEFDQPHFRIFSKNIEFYRQDKVKTSNNLVFVGGVPILYIPKYSHSLKDPLIHVRLVPGRKKDWGSYMLSAWRYNLADHLRGRLYLDYRERLGLAQGFGFNYGSAGFGSGDFKFYYTNERPRRINEDISGDFQRYLARWRHMWNITPRTRATVEYYKISDSKRAALGTEHHFLKDYFEREYEKNEYPKTYVLISHNFNYSSLSLLANKRINRWYPHINEVPDEKLPEVSFSLPGYKLAGTPLYFSSQSIFSNLSNRYPDSSQPDLSVTRFDTYNQLSLPTKLWFVWLNPYAGIRETFYSKDADGSSVFSSPRTTFYSGAELSTKFYRLFNASSNFLGMDINGLRHILTPVIKYSYINEPTIPASKLRQFDSIDSISHSNKATLEVENKLQTKDSKGKARDFAVLRVSTDYDFKPKHGAGSSFSDFLFDLELIPYAWLRIESDATYDQAADNFKAVNVDAYANLGKQRSFGIGHRYARTGGKELTSQLRWRINPKWQFRIYERYQFDARHTSGLKEQEYAISRDLHCWTMDLSFNIKKGEGVTMWVVFRLKAFSEIELGFNQSYKQPKED